MSAGAKTLRIASTGLFCIVLAAGCPAAASLPVTSPGFPARAPDQAPDQGSKFTLEGKITELAAGKLTVNTEDNIIFQVTYSVNTEIRRKDGTAGSSKDFAAGEKIKVEGTLTPAGVIEARSIDIE